MSIKRQRASSAISRKQAENLLYPRNTILIGLPSSSLPDTLDGFTMDRSVTLVKPPHDRKLRISESAGRLTYWKERISFVSSLQSTEWFVEIDYNQSFNHVDYMDYRRAKVKSLLRTLLTLVTLDWTRLWIAFTHKRPESEHLVIAYPLSSIWILDESLVVREAEVEPITEKHIRLYRSYRRRLGTITEAEGPILVALQFYWHHLTLDSLYMRALALCVSLESLFNAGPHEIRRTIGLCVADLLANDLESKKRIYREVVRLYDYRSKISHGTLKLLHDENSENEFKDLSSLHEYTRRCLRALIEKRRLAMAFCDNKTRIDTINQALLTGHF